MAFFCLANGNQFLPFVEIKRSPLHLREVQRDCVYL